MFDRIAPRYDEIWTDTTIGRLQRDAVWRGLAPIVQTGMDVLDVGCGTGEDARWLASCGACVVAVDASGEMVRVARSRGVDARVMGVQGLREFDVSFDFVVSDFGALNCVPVAEWRANLEAVVRPGGWLAICVIGRFCLWESVWYGLRGQFRKAARRWNGQTGQITYPTTRQIELSLAPAFRLVRSAGIGVAVPPSYVSGLPDGLLRAMGAIDARVESMAAFRMLADHRLLVFRR